MGRARGANAVVAFGFEDTYGTPKNTGNRKISIVSTTLGEEQGLLDPGLIGQGREPERPVDDVPSNVGDVVVPVDLRNFGLWLKLLFGAPTTDDSDDPVFAHTFVSGALALPSASIEIGSPDVPAYNTNYGAMANTLSIQFQRGGLLNATIGMICQGETDPVTGSAMGTLTTLATLRFPMKSSFVKKDGVLIGSLQSGAFTFNNNLDQDESLREDGRIGGADPATSQATLEMRVRRKDITLEQAAAGGDPCELEFGWSLGAGMTLSFTLAQVDLPKPKKPVTGPQGIDMTYTGIASKPGSGRQVTVVLTNDVEAY